MRDTLATRLRRLRRLRGLSQQALADRVGVPRHTITRIEAGKLMPKADLAVALEMAVDGEPGSLLYKEGMPRFPEGVLDMRPVIDYCSPEGRKLMGKLLAHLANLLT